MFYRYITSSFYTCWRISLKTSKRQHEKNYPALLKDNINDCTNIDFNMCSHSSHCRDKNRCHVVNLGSHGCIGSSWTIETTFEHMGSLDTLDSLERLIMMMRKILILVSSVATWSNKTCSRFHANRCRIKLRNIQCTFESKKPMDELKLRSQRSKTRLLKERYDLL